MPTTFLKRTEREQQRLLDLEMTDELSSLSEKWNLGEYTSHLTPELVYTLPRSADEKYENYREKKRDDGDEDYVGG